MTVDKRSVHTDALHTLGFIHTQTECRDAIHLAVEQVTAGSYLTPGAHIGRDADGKYTIRAPGEGLGIVDPFIQGMVRPGDQFWLVVYPRKITSLRHVWSHPDFDDLTSDLPEVRSAITPESINQMIEEEKKLYADIDADRLAKFVEKERKNAGRSSAAWVWLRNYADDLRVDVDELLENADEYQNSDWHYWSQGEKFEGEYIPDQFWDYYAEVRGLDRSDLDKDGSFFSCSC